MKRVAISALALLLCIAFAVFNSLNMASVSDSLLQKLEVCDALYESDKASAVKAYEYFFENFNRVETYLCISLNHEEIDILREAVAKTYSYIQTDEAAEFKAEYFALYRLLEHLGELERPSLENLF